MGQQFVEVTSLRYGGRSVISKRSLNGCSPGYKLSMASEGSRTACKHCRTKQTSSGVLVNLFEYCSPFLEQIIRPLILSAAVLRGKCLSS